MLKIGIVVASIRDARVGKDVAVWVHNEAQKFDGVNQYELIDLKTFDLPFMGATPKDNQANEIARWSSTISSLDGLIIVTPEYNHMIPGALKNAFDFLKPEVANKPLGMVGYGFLGAGRALNTARTTFGSQGLFTVQQQVNLSMNLDFENATVFKPKDYHIREVQNLVAQVVGIGKALKSYRENK